MSSLFNNTYMSNNIFIVCCDLVDLEMIDKDLYYQSQIFLLLSLKSPEKTKWNVKGTFGKRDQLIWK